MIDPLNYWMSAWLIGWLVPWLIEGAIERLIHCWNEGLINWFVELLIKCLVGRLIRVLIEWFVGWLIEWLINGMIDRLSTFSTVAISCHFLMFHWVIMIQKAISQFSAWLKFRFLCKIFLSIHAIFFNIKLICCYRIDSFHSERKSSF